MAAPLIIVEREPITSGGLPGVDYSDIQEEFADLMAPPSLLSRKDTRDGGYSVVQLSHGKQGVITATAKWQQLDRQVAWIDRMKEHSKTIEQDLNTFSFMGIFNDKRACMRYMENCRWPDGISCPRCLYPKTYVIEGGRRYMCASRECRLFFTFSHGTIFSNTKLELSKWLYAIYLMSTGKRATSSVHLAAELNISQTSAWYMMNSLRSILHRPLGYKFNGTVEIDEAIMGSRRGVWERYGKRPVYARKMVLGMYERNAAGNIMIVQIGNRKKETIRSIVNAHIEPGSTLATDSWRSYRCLHGEYSHGFVDHKAREFVRGEVHTNNIENVWGRFKRAIRYAHMTVSPQHLQHYCDEFVYRHNNRTLSTHQRFADILRRSLLAA